MRVKTEEKRQAILKVAAEVFETQGFEAASMTQIAAGVGGSKGTLYSYFASKEELFIEVMLILAKSHKKHLEGFTCNDDDIHKTLTSFGNAYLSFITKPFFIDMYRTVIGFKNNTGVRRQFYEKGPLKGYARIAGFMEKAIEGGHLIAADTTLMAFQYKALLDAELLQPLMMDAIAQPSAADIEIHVARACSSFLKIYAR